MGNNDIRFLVILNNVTWMDCSIDGLNYFIEIDYDLQDKNSIFVF